jgi:hypothetical protein
MEERNKDAFSKIEKLNLGLGIINTIAVIIAIWIAVLGINSNEKIAEKSGVFDKGELKLSFGGYLILPDVDYDVYYGIDFSDSSLHFATLPISLHNSGKKTIEDLSLIYKYPHLANIAVDSLIEFEYIFDDKFERRYNTVEPYDQVLYKLNSIHPNYSVQIGDLICLQGETILHDKKPVEFNDGGVLDISTSIKYGFQLNVGLIARDTEASYYSFILNYRNESNLDNLVKQILNDKLSQTGKVIKNFFVIIPKIQNSVGENDTKITLMSSDASNTLFCHFDESMENVFIRNQDGGIEQIFKIDK